ncbi:MAG: hypothetical protein IKW85_07695 [Muribaculaceae bacterium]|nr:hypothetical protein [Muribaculaceae bacterium]
MKTDVYRLVMTLMFMALVVATMGAEQVGARYQGSAPALDGKIYVLTCYVTETSWTDEEIASCRVMIHEAEDWLASQAEAYGRDVSFQNGSFGIETPLIMNQIVSGKGVGDEPVDLVSKVMKKIGYVNGLEFVDWVHSNTDCTGCLVLIVANKPGRGYSMAYRDDYDRKKYFLEGTMLYTSYEEGDPYCAASIAHEMCHLFGAEDLYATFVQTEENEALARELFPDDIMLKVAYDIDTLKIDNLTAWLIGLTDDMEDWYMSFLCE